MMAKKRNYDITKDKIEELTTTGKLLFEKPLLKFFYLSVIYLLLSYFQESISESFPLRSFIIILEILIGIYFIAVIVFLIRHWYDRFVNPESLPSLILTYALFIFGILLMFSTLLSIIELTRIGYIKYGMCTDKFDPSFILNDPEISREFFYYTAITFFTVGYGDICPMGFAKLFSIIIAFTGHIVSLVILALILNNYYRKRKDN
jgi:hypothetical protein